MIGLSNHYMVSTLGKISWNCSGSQNRPREHQNTKILKIQKLRKFSHSAAVHLNLFWKKIPHDIQKINRASLRISGWFFQFPAVCLHWRFGSAVDSWFDFISHALEKESVRRIPVISNYLEISTLSAKHTIEAWSVITTVTKLQPDWISLRLAERAFNHYQISSTYCLHSFG